LPSGVFFLNFVFISFLLFVLMLNYV